MTENDQLLFEWKGIRETYIFFFNFKGKNNFCLESMVISTGKLPAKKEKRSSTLKTMTKKNPNTIGELGFLRDDSVTIEAMMTASLGSFESEEPLTRDYHELYYNNSVLKSSRDFSRSIA